MLQQWGSLLLCMTEGTSSQATAVLLMPVALQAGMAAAAGRDLKGLTVLELKQELTSRSLETTGKKADLMARLGPVLEEEAAAAAAKAAEEAAKAEAERVKREQVGLCAIGLSVWGQREALSWTSSLQQQLPGLLERLQRLRLRGSSGNRWSSACASTAVPGWLV